MKGEGTILVLSDDPESSRMIIDMLTGHGYNVQQPGRVISADDSTPLSVPDLILIDFPAAEANSLNIGGQFGRGPGTRAIPILVVSGELGSRQFAGLPGAEAVDFISKPFRREELLARVGTHLELSRSRRQFVQQFEERTTRMRAAVEKLRRELTVRKRAETALCKRRFREIADAVPVMMVASDIQNRATFFNRAWRKFRGRSLQQEREEGWTEGLHPDERDWVIGQFYEAVKAGRDCSMEYRLRRSDGEYRWVLCLGAPCLHPDGTFPRYIASCIDVTEFREARDPGLKKAENLAIAAAGIAHDFKNLLGCVFAEADLAIREPGTGEATIEYIRNIISISESAAEMAEAMATLAADEVNPVVEMVNLSDVTEEALRLLHATLSRTGLTIRSRLNRHLPLIRARALQIRRVIMNLVANAAEALEGRDGIISIRTSAVRFDSDREGEIWNVQRGDYVKLIVCDTGAGMSEETQAKAVDPFVTTKPHGLGMGLTVVQNIVRSHHGAVRIHSGVGAGSAFEVLLPCAVQAFEKSIQIPQLLSPETPSAGPVSVLLVEGRYALRTTIAKYLRKSGFRVIGASDGHEALELIRDLNEKIDFVLLETALSGISIERVLAETRQIRPEVRIVLKSDHYPDDTHASGINYETPPVFIRRPYSLEELAKALREKPGHSSHTLRRTAAR
jgi:PAS domain S-box-containing protein